MSKRFRVHVESTSNYYIDVDAEDAEQAKEIASGIDGGEFLEDGLGSWDITTADEIKKFVVLRGLKDKNVFWSTNSDNNTHSAEGELWYEEMFFTNSEEEAILKCNELKFK